MARGRHQAERQGPDTEALKLEVHRGQLLEGWQPPFRGVCFGLVDNREGMLSARLGK